MKKLFKLVAVAIVAVTITTVSGSWTWCPTHPTPNIVFIPNPDDCSTFFQCDNGIAVEVGCPDGLYFCAEKYLCTWNWDPECRFDCATSGGGSRQGTLMGNAVGDTFCCCPGTRSCVSADCSTINVRCP